MTKTEQNRLLAWRLKVMREASAAPAPIATNTTGSTQHTSVAELASNAPAARPALRANAGLLTAFPP